MGVKPVNREAIKNMKKIEIPKTLGGLPVISIGDHAFEDCDKLEDITMPDSVTTIGDYAFYDCNGLNGRYEWNNIQSIGNYAFAHCDNESVFWIIRKPTRTSYIYIGDYCFAWSSGLVDWEGSDSVTGIYGKGIFYNNTVIGGIGGEDFYSSDFGRANVDTIPIDFCRSCSKIYLVAVKNGTTSIMSGAFYDCPKLTEIKIAPSVTSIAEDGLDPRYLQVIYGKPGSEAEKYAKAHNIKFVNVKDMKNSDKNNAGSGGSSGSSTPNTTNISDGSKNREKTDTNQDIVINGITWTYTLKDGKATQVKPKTKQNTATVNIPDKIEGHTVTGIAANAFEEWSNLNSVTIPKTVTKIGKEAFKDCTKLSTLDLPKKLITIGDYAFQRCTSLEKVTIKKNVKTVGEGAFKGCVSLKRVRIKGAKTEVGKEAFKNCEKLQYAIIFRKPVKIGTDAFDNDNSSTLTICAKVNSDARAYADSHNNIKYATLKSYLSLGAEAEDVEDDKYTANGVTWEFEVENGTVVDLMPADDSALPSKVNVPETINNMPVKSIAGNAFANQTNLTEIVVPESITEIGSYAFSGCTNLTSCSVRGITEIPEGLFEGCSGLAKVDLYNCLEVGERAFEGNSSLNVIGLDSAKYIGDYAFAGCTSLNNITSWTNLESIGKGAFENCPGLKTIILTDKITNISESAFANCENISSVVVYGNIETMGQGAFEGCKNLTTVTVNGTLEMIGDRAFAECENLSSINLKSGLTYIGNSAFEGCTVLSNVSIPNTVTEIGRAAFWKCRALTKIDIPSSVTKIEPVAFAECDNLKSITVDEQNANYCADGGVLYTKSKDTLKCYPAGKTGSEDIFRVETPVKTIEDYAFAGCKVSNIILKSGVTTLGHNILVNSKTVLLQVPSTVTNFEYTTFDETAELFKVFCMATAPVYEFAVTHDISIYCIKNDDEEVFASTTPGYVYYYKLLDDNGVDIIDSSREDQLTTAHAYAVPSTIKDTSGIERRVRAFTIGFSKDFGRVDIPVSVMTLKENQFAGFNSLNWIGFSYKDEAIGSEGLKVMEKSAFAGTNLQTISRGEDVASENNDLPASLEVIGSSAFANCRELEKIHIPDKVEEILENTFADCIKLQSVTLPSNLKKIDDGAFAGCVQLTNIKLPDSITYIGSKAFKGCVGLKKITLPKNKDIYIEPDAFEGCPNLLIDIDRNQLNIAEYAEDNEIPYMAGFETNSQILLQIGNIRYMYKLNDGDSNLQLYGWELRNGAKPDEVEEVYIPEKVAGYKVEEIKENLFKGFNNLDRIYTTTGSVGRSYAIENNIPYVLPESTLLNYPGVDTTETVCGSKKYGMDWIYAMYEDGKDTTIKPNTETYPETVIIPYYIDGFFVKALGPGSFITSCSEMKNVVISNGIEKIYSGDFKDCADLEKLVIPKSVKEIQGDSIKNCGNVTIYCYKDSVAAKYAQENNITYKLIDENEGAEGEIDGLIKRITFNDKNLYNKIVEQLDVLDADETAMTIDITLEALNEVTELDLSNAQIQSLDGIENFTNLVNLNLAGNSITDLSKLENLNNLQSLNLLNNSIKDISALNSLTSLKVLKIGNDVERTSIESLSTIEKLINLEELTMVYLNIQDLTPFSKLTKLTNLDLSFNNISDVSELGKITSLKKLQLISNKISNIDGLKTLTNLQDLNLYDNQIEDISALEGLDNLDTLLLANQKLNTEAMEGTTIDLPEIFKQATQADSIGYMGLNDFTLENCTQGEDKTKVTIDEGVETASVTITGGVLKGTKLSIEVTKNPDLPEVRLRGIEITKAPSKINYTAGEKFSTDGMEVTARYSNGTTKVLTESEYTIEPSGALTTENTSVTISYTESVITKQTTQEITVTPKQGQDPDPEKTVTSITLKQMPTKIKYKQSKEDLDVTGGKIEVTYSDGSKEIIDITTDMVTGFDNTKLGKQVLTISYGGKTINYEIEIVADGSGGGSQGGSGDEGQGGSGSGDQGGSGDEGQGGSGSGDQGGSGDEGQGGSGTGNQSGEGSGSGDQNGTGSGNSQNKTGNDSTVKKDVSGEDLTAKGSFPYTGRAVIGVVGIALATLAGISYISYKKYKNI